MDPQAPLGTRRSARHHRQPPRRQDRGRAFPCTRVPVRRRPPLRPAARPGAARPTSQTPEVRVFAPDRHVQAGLNGGGGPRLADSTGESPRRPRRFARRRRSRRPSGRRPPGPFGDAPPLIASPIFFDAAFARPERVSLAEKCTPAASAPNVPMMTAGSSPLSIAPLRTASALLADSLRSPTSPTSA